MCRAHDPGLARVEMALFNKVAVSITNEKEERTEKRNIKTTLVRRVLGNRSLTSLIFTMGGTL